MGDGEVPKNNQEQGMSKDYAGIAHQVATGVGLLQRATPET
jgi:hypothetical protein